MNNPKILQYAKNHGWSYVSSDEQTETYFFVKGKYKVNFYDGKRSVAITINKKQKFFRGLHVDELESIFSRTEEIYAHGYATKDEGKRVWIRFEDDDPQFN